MIACLALSSSGARSPAPGGRGKKEETLHGLIRTQQPSHHWLLLAHPCLVLPREGLGVSVVGLFHRAALWLPLSNNQCGLAMFRVLKSSGEVLLCYKGILQELMVPIIYFPPRQRVGSWVALYTPLQAG